MPRLALADAGPTPDAAPPAAAPADLCPGALLHGRSGAWLDAHNAGGAVVLGHRHALVEAAAGAATSRDPARLHAAAGEALARVAPDAEAVALGADGGGAVAAGAEAVRRLSGRETVLDLAALPGSALAERFARGGVAAVIADPLALDMAAGERLRVARALCDRHGAALIVDERLAAPRWSQGGAQALFGVRADLAVYGSALANGRRFAAVAGRRDLVAAARLVGPEAFQPDLAALAAVPAVALVLDHAPVRAVLQVRGSEVQAELEAALAAAGVADVCRVAGDPVAVRLVFDHPRIAPVRLQRRLRAELRRRGVFMPRDRIHVSYAWGDAEVSAFVDAMTAALGALARSLPPRRRLAAAA